MKTKTILTLSLVFAIVSFLSFFMRDDPLNMAVNTNSFDLGKLGTDTITIKYSSLSLMIFLPCTYFAIALVVIGLLQVTMEKLGGKTVQ